MKINIINKTISSTSPYDKNNRTIGKDNAKSGDKTPIIESDSYVPSTKVKNTELGNTYTRDTNTIAKLRMDTEKQTQQLKDIVEKLIIQQGEKFQESGMIKIDPDTALKAQEEISEDGYWGIKQTSERLFDFAKALTGGDHSKAQAMKDAFIEGFKKAKEAWSGELPEISNKTYEATIKMFDEWIGEHQ